VKKIGGEEVLLAQLEFLAYGCLDCDPLGLELLILHPMVMSKPSQMCEVEELCTKIMSPAVW